MRLSKAHCLEMNMLRQRKSRGYITRQSRVRGPSMTPRMVRGDHLRRHVWSGRPCMAPWMVRGPCNPSWMVRGDLVWRKGTYGVITGPAGPTVWGDHIWHDITPSQLCVASIESELVCEMNEFDGHY